MQGRVSMVMPCYNKEAYIASMLQSVENQIWDNIELLLVNDGSTDRTREIISEWQPRLTARGYGVVIIDQQNQGVTAAVYEGLRRCTGDYFCLVDSDDELHPEYCSRMAGWLDEHGDYEWAACHFELISGVERVRSFWPAAVSPEAPRLLENWLLWRATMMVWIYMTRIPYLKRCGMMDAFYTGRSVTYEPSIAIPLMVGGGKLKFFNEPLYIYKKFASDLSAFPVFSKVLSYYSDHLRQIEWVLSKLPVTERERRRYTILARIAERARITAHMHVPGNEECRPEMANGISALLDEMLLPPPHISADRILEMGLPRFFRFVQYKLLRLDREFEAAVAGKSRIIGYGALGKQGRLTLPRLLPTPFRPTVIWDVAADGGEVSGIPAEKPDLGSLSAADAVIVFPRKRVVLDEIEPQLRACKTGVVLRNEDFDEYFQLLEIPELANAEFSD